MIEAAYLTNAKIELLMSLITLIVDFERIGCYLGRHGVSI